MKIYYIFTFILLGINTNSCKPQEERMNKLKEFTTLQNARDNSLVYVIPGAGCPGCISEAEKFAIEKRNNDSFYFVFTRISSNKLFALKFPYLLTAKNVIIDSQNIYKHAEEKFDIYPVIYQKQQDKFVLKQYLKPD